MEEGRGVKGEVLKEVGIVSRVHGPVTFSLENVLDRCCERESGSSMEASR